MSLTNQARRAAAALMLAVPAFAAWADSPANGATLYTRDCASCHGATPLSSNSNKIYNGRNARTVIDSGISNVGDMKPLRGAYPAGGSALADVAAYLGNTPTSIGFGSTAVGASSAAQTVTVYASLKAGASIANLSVATSGDFARSGGTCGTAVATGTSCTVGVVFSPTATGARSGTLTLAHGNTLAPIAIALSGSATGGATSAPAASLTSASLGFGSTAVGATSAAQNITLGNSGNAALSLASIGYSSADFFTAGGTCAAPGSVAAGSSCTLSVGFRPSSGASGARNATLTIAHNAAGGSSVASLSGTAAAAAAPAASMTASLAFGSVNVGSSSTAQTATLSNTGNASLTLGSIATGSSEFAVSGGSCSVGGNRAAGSSCSVNIVFTPSAAL
jgi:mono/diheme cytochrome c family protein